MGQPVNGISPENRLREADNQIAETNRYFTQYGEKPEPAPKAIEIVRSAKRDNDKSILPPGYKAVLVAVAAILGASILAMPVLAEDVKLSYDPAYIDEDQAYLNWWSETEKIIETDKYSMLYAMERDDAKDLYKWSKKLEYDAGEALFELEQFDDVSPELQLVINKDGLRYEELKRAGYHC